MNIKILIVDDEPSNTELLEALLEPEGYTLIKVKNGEDALEYLSGNEPDLVLLDVVMPGISGFFVLKEIRRNEKNRAVPVILLTSLSDREDKLKGLGAGADDYISKPFDRVELLFKVHTQAGLSILRRQVNEKEKLAGVMDLLLEGAVLTDCNFNIQQMNKTAMEMLRLKDTSGNIEEILLKTFGYIVERDINNGKFMVGRPETTSYPAECLSVEYHRVPKINGIESSYVFVFKDVTEIFSRNKMKTDFLALLSLKLRAPLTVISGYSTMLSVFESEKKLKDIAMAIMRSSEFMESIIKRVLFFVEIENTSLTENEIVFDAKELAGRLSVVYAKPCNLAIQAEPAKIKYWQEIAAEELIANAIKFCDKEEAKVSVIIDADRIIVEDNGPGIPAGEYKKVFEPFYQINKSNTGNTAGLGIGLSIVKRLCESANMRVKLEKSFDGGLKVAIGRY